RQCLYRNVLRVRVNDPSENPHIQDLCLDVPKSRYLTGNWRSCHHNLRVGLGWAGNLHEQSTGLTPRAGRVRHGDHVDTGKRPTKALPTGGERGLTYHTISNNGSSARGDPGN